MLTFLSKKIQFDDIFSLVNEKLKSGGSVTFTPYGKSMLPMINGTTDSVKIEKLNRKIKKYDVLLYQQPNNGLFIIHRVIGFDKNANPIFCGDNEFTLEYGVKKENVKGILTEFVHKEKNKSVNSISYKIYSLYICKFRIFRRVFFAIKRKILIRK